MDETICIGIESTAHTFGAGIIGSGGRVYANSRDTYKPKSGYGIIPQDAALHMRSVSDAVISRALESAGMGLDQVDIISFSRGPGLPLSLRVGMEKASGLAHSHEKPLYGANHCIGHIEIGMLETGAIDPITVYASGGNTQVMGFTESRYRIFGETLDIALGNAFDMFARAAGLEHPGGPKIEKLAENGKYIELPYVVKGMDLSYTGLVSQAIRLLKKESLEDLCFSLQETCFAMLTEVSERALAHTGKSEILLTGGVAANSRLQEMLKTMCSERGATFRGVPMDFAGDNGIMIAWTGQLMHRSGCSVFDLARDDILPRWRTDEVDVRWKEI